jgi:hypothetical protein
MFFARKLKNRLTILLHAGNKVPDELETTMPITPDPRREQRLADAIRRGGFVGAVHDALKFHRVCDLAHARTNREDDYLDLLLAEYELAEAIGQITGWDMCERQAFIMEETRSECRFDIKEGLYLNDDGELISGGGRPVRGPDPDAAWNGRDAA